VVISFEQRARGITTIVATEAAASIKLFWLALMRAGSVEI